MIRRVVLICGALLLLIFVPRIYENGVWLGFWQPLIRPPGVSKSARYISLVEEATWFDCQVDLKRDVDVCRAWKEDGRLIVNGDFRLEDENRAASKSELRPSRVLLDAGMRSYMIYLFGQNGAFSKILVPVNSSSKMP
jgi:hypothetical protein